MSAAFLKLSTALRDGLISASAPVVCQVRSGSGGAKREGRGQLVEDGEQLVDLVVGVGGGDLQAEADLVAGHTRIERQRRVDAVVEQELAHPVEVVGVGERDLDDRARGAELVQVVEDAASPAVQAGA